MKLIKHYHTSCDKTFIKTAHTQHAHAHKSHSQTHKRVRTSQAHPTHDSSVWPCVAIFITSLSYLFINFSLFMGAFGEGDLYQILSFVELTMCRQTPSRNRLPCLTANRRISLELVSFRSLNPAPQTGDGSDWNQWKELFPLRLQA